MRTPTIHGPAQRLFDSHSIKVIMSDFMQSLDLAYNLLGR